MQEFQNFQMIIQSSIFQIQSRIPTVGEIPRTTPLPRAWPIKEKKNSKSPTCSPSILRLPRTHIWMSLHWIREDSHLGIYKVEPTILFSIFKDVTSRPKRWFRELKNQWWNMKNAVRDERLNWRARLVMHHCSNSSIFEVLDLFFSVFSRKWSRHIWEHIRICKSLRLFRLYFHKIAKVRCHGSESVAKHAQRVTACLVIKDRNAYRVWVWVFSERVAKVSFLLLVLTNNPCDTQVLSRGPRAYFLID